MAAILANQTAVALRNAQLYHQVPMVDALGALAAKKQGAPCRPRRKLQTMRAVRSALAGSLVPVPLAPSGDRAAEPVSGRSAMRRCERWWPGVVERVLVSEGASVSRGAPLATLRATDLMAERASQRPRPLEAADRSAALAASRGDAAEERLQRIRG